MCQLQHHQLHELTANPQAYWVCCSFFLAGNQLDGTLDQMLTLCLLLWLLNLIVLIGQGDSEMDAARQIWGTTYSQKEMQQMIRRFFTTFHARSPTDKDQQAEDGSAGMPTYVSLLRQVRMGLRYALCL